MCGRPPRGAGGPASSAGPRGSGCRVVMEEAAALALQAAVSAAGKMRCFVVGFFYYVNNDSKGRALGDTFRSRAARCNQNGAGAPLARLSLSRPVLRPGCGGGEQPPHTHRHGAPTPSGASSGARGGRPVPRHGVGNCSLADCVRPSSMYCCREKK